jgi:hypothetical protein
MASNQPNSPRSVSTVKTFRTAPTFYSEKSNASQNLSGFENQLYASEAASAASPAPSFYSAEGPASQNLSGFENQVDSSSAASSAAPVAASSAAPVAASSAAPVVPIIVDSDNYNVKLASNPNMIQSMYIIVKSAGATSHPIFNENDITVTGGAAYRMYAEVNGLLPKMRTSDIDMVWWTRQRQENDVIRSLVPVFCERIVLSSRIVEIHNRLIRIIQPIHPVPIQTIDFQVIDAQPYVQAGVIINSNIHISILINGTHLIKNLCEISIHNGISSQRFNIKHRYLGSNYASSNTKFATADPIYCDHTAKYTAELFSVRVPDIERYIIQQLFAYKNLRIQADAISIPKSHIRLYRVLHFCLIKDPKINKFIDEQLAQSVHVILIHLTNLRGIQDHYVAEVEKDLYDLHTLTGSQYPFLFPITYTTLKHEQQRLHMEHHRREHEEQLQREREEQLQRRKGGFRKKRTVKRKKNKSKTKKRSSR